MIHTEDESEAKMVIDGFRYLVQMEFRKQQPILASFYELEFVNPLLSPGGSFRYTDKIVAKLKNTLLKDELKKLRGEKEEEEIRKRVRAAWERIERKHVERSIELREIEKELWEIKESLKKKRIETAIALMVALGPVLQPISQAVVDRVFPPIQSRVEKQLNDNHAPHLIEVEFNYLSNR